MPKYTEKDLVNIPLKASTQRADEWSGITRARLGRWLRVLVKFWIPVERVPNNMDNYILINAKHLSKQI